MGILKRGFFLRGPFLFGLIYLIAVSCAGPRAEKGSRITRIIEGIPFYPQESFQCGPASLAGVLNYWGVSVSPAEIASEIYSKTARGTLDFDLVLYAEKKGLQARAYEGTWQDMKDNIDQGHPLIVLVDYGFWVYEKSHFMVVVGYDGEDGLIANSGKDRETYIRRSSFLGTWERTKFWTLLITAK